MILFSRFQIHVVHYVVILGRGVCEIEILTDKRVNQTRFSNIISCLIVVHICKYRQKRKNKTKQKCRQFCNTQYRFWFKCSGELRTEKKRKILKYKYKTRTNRIPTGHFEYSGSLVKSVFFYFYFLWWERYHDGKYDCMNVLTLIYHKFPGRSE